ncbi:hypothetical protein LOZ80_05425 [Paenibacillus sp. HWE-109]|nr:hypothetical protein [Paenibacillus sp. HWE-109]UKS28378.1 hypothetical protein LOZ80_05425 [Paenibacillus sp. HWE-109]
MSHEFMGHPLFIGVPADFLAAEVSGLNGHLTNCMMLIDVKMATSAN